MKSRDKGFQSEKTAEIYFVKTKIEITKNYNTQIHF